MEDLMDSNKGQPSGKDISKVQIQWNLLKNSPCLVNKKFIYILIRINEETSSILSNEGTL